MAFHEVRFPAGLSFGAAGGPERRTQIVTLASGFEERNTPWAESRRRYDAGLGLRSLDDVEAILTFFEERRGQLHGFRWKDWSDFRSCRPSGIAAGTDQFLGEGDGVARRFSLRKTYGAGRHAYARPIAKPVVGTVLVAIDGRDLSMGDEVRLDPASGEISLDKAPPPGARITAGFEFDVPVRFDTDRIEVSLETFQAGQVPHVPVVEVRV